jgi:hypothetical protein
LKGRVFYSLLVIGFIAQLYFLSSGTLLPLWRDIRSVAGLSQEQRSARLSFGDQFSAYVLFINDVVPEDGRVVLPPVSVDPTFGNMGIMQFFLFPRSIVNCPSVEAAQECLDLFQGSETYFLSVKSFPGQSQVGGTRRHLPFGSDLGLLLPPGS